MSNLGLWDRWYSLPGMEEPQPYGDSPTYMIGAHFLADCATVADWGCGKGWMRHLVAGAYTGVDGSVTPHADVIADLADYAEPSDGIFLRHVLEHDYRWRDILRNAATAARERLVVVLFTPLVDETCEVAWNDEPGVPDLSFALADLLAELDGFDVTVLDVPSPETQYETETVLLCEVRA